LAQTGAECVASVFFAKESDDRQIIFNKHIPRGRDQEKRILILQITTFTKNLWIDPVLQEPKGRLTTLLRKRGGVSWPAS
jgi:hypothetical protein